MKQISEKNINLLVSFRLLTNLWTVITLILFIIDFYSGNKYDSATSIIGIIYVGVLGIYAGSKEFERWQNKNYISYYIGEYFVVAWTIIAAIFVFMAPFSNGLFRVPEEFGATYIAVLAIFAITRRSKVMRARKGVDNK